MTGHTGSPTPTPAPVPSSSGPGAPKVVIQFLDQGGMAGHTVQVDALDSTIHNGNATDATFLWNFGDPNGTYNTLPGWNAAHRYDQPGTYTVTLTITDKAGQDARPPAGPSPSPPTPGG